MINYLEILAQVRTYTTGLFHDKKDDRLIYHNISHTEQVVQAAVKIANHYKLSDQDFFIVNTAAWFHDIGYLTRFEDHEATGAESAKVFLNSKSVEPDVIANIVNCILATKMPQQPVGLLEQIICDADLFHLGGVDFKKRNKLMREEVEAFYGKEIDKNQWRLKTIELFEGHHYHTSYCQELLDSEKQLNLQELKDKSLKEVNMDNKKDKKHEKQDKKRDHESKKKHHDDEQLSVHEGETEVKKKKKDRPEKGIETMFRITSGNNQRLSDMADRKAHIMIQTNAIILSVILSLLLRKLEDNPHLIIPTLVLLVICVTTMVFSILSTRPTVPEGTFTAEDIASKKVNLLFFGNFYRMHLPDYEAGMEKMMEDREFLYGTLIKDVYSQGVVLGRKYRLLRIAYNVFMFGIIAAVLAFMIAIAFVRLQG